MIWKRKPKRRKKKKRKIKKKSKDLSTSEKKKILRERIGRGRGCVYYEVTGRE